MDEITATIEELDQIQAEYNVQRAALEARHIAEREHLDQIFQQRLELKHAQLHEVNTLCIRWLKARGIENAPFKLRWSEWVRAYSLDVFESNRVAHGFLMQPTVKDTIEWLRTQLAAPPAAASNGGATGTNDTDTATA